VRYCVAGGGSWALGAGTPTLAIAGSARPATDA
jgi:hypothetical protein